MYGYIKLQSANLWSSGEMQLRYLSKVILKLINTDLNHFVLNVIKLSKVNHFWKLQQAHRIWYNIEIKSIIKQDKVF